MPIKLPICLKFVIILVIWILLSLVSNLLKFPGANINNMAPIPNNKTLVII